MPQTQSGTRVQVNGEAVHLAADSRLPDLLTEMDMDPEKVRGVAVAVNEEVVPRRRWHEVVLHEGDRIEVVTAKQGG